MATSDAAPRALSRARLRVLIVAPFPPQATGRHGGARALAANLLAIASRHEVAIAYVPDSSASEPDETVAKACALVEALPAPEVHGPRRWLRRLAVDAALLRGVPIWASELRTKAAAAQLSALATAWRPDVVQFEFLPTTVFFEALGEVRCPESARRPRRRLAAGARLRAPARLGPEVAARPGRACLAPPRRPVGRASRRNRCLH